MPKTTEVLKNYISGKWVESKSKHVLDVLNPATGEVLGGVPLSSGYEADQAVQAASEAFRDWKDTPLSKRITYLSKFRDLLIENSKELARTITKEHGKVLSDARGEMQRAIENATKALDISFTQGRMLSNIASGRINEYVVRVPKGVFLAVTPFNFPAMILFWFMPYALSSGNTFIVKPSEQTPITMELIFKLIEKAGFPAGVVNLINGDKAVVEHFLEHSDIKGVCSVSSTPAMTAIHQKAALSQKDFICQGGAKNPVVILPDANPRKFVHHIIDSFYGNTGQRCLAGGNLVVVGHSEKQYKILIQELVEHAKQIRIGNGLERGVRMGPVISKTAQGKIISYIEVGISEGANLILDGRDIEVNKYPNGNWIGPSIFTDVTPNMTIAKEEIFGPVIPILRTKTLDEAIEIANGSRFGNAGMIFTTSGKAAQRFRDEINAGNIGINVGLPAPVPPFSFGGMKDSFRGVIHGQGIDIVNFFTEDKVVIERWLDDD